MRQLNNHHLEGGLGPMLRDARSRVSITAPGGPFLLADSPQLCEEILRRLGPAPGLHTYGVVTYGHDASGSPETR